MQGVDDVADDCEHDEEDDDDERDDDVAFDHFGGCGRGAGWVGSEGRGLEWCTGSWRSAEKSRRWRWA